jgi:hypothetical protein
MARVVEQGDCFFFYRPRVGATEVDDLEDVQRFFVVLAPDRRPRYREIIVGAKRLPDPERHERLWAFVAKVAAQPEQLREEIGRREYATKTRGIRVQPEARPAGEARYGVVEHDDHTHLAYVLELPADPGPAQQAFRIVKEGSYVVAVRNPDAPAPPGAGLPPTRRAELPAELRARFGDRRFIALDTPELLDFEGIELVLIGASAAASEELGIELDAEAERLHTAEILRRLRIRPGEIPVEPLDTGELL